MPLCIYNTIILIGIQNRAESRALFYTTLFNLTGYPVVVIPLTLSSKGLPIGVQLVGNYGNDQKLLTIASQISSIINPLPCPL